MIFWLSAAWAAEPCVVARVNTRVVTCEEFQQAAARRTPADGLALSAAERQEVLDHLVEEKILLDEAWRKGLQDDPKVQKVMVNTLLRQEVYNAVQNSDFTDEILEAYFRAHQDEFIVPSKVQIKRIVIKVDGRGDAAARAIAEQAWKKLYAAPETFSDVASEVSEDPYRRRGGDVGFVGPDGKPGLDEALVAYAFTLRTGELSPVFYTADGYNIILVAARREAVERTFGQMKGSVLRKVKNERMKGLYDAYVAQARQGAQVSTDTAVLDSLPVETTRRPFGAPFTGEDAGEDDPTL